jgi:HEAT repeat protein
MRRHRWIGIALLLGATAGRLWAQNPEELLKTYTRNFVIASLDIKVQIVQDAGATGLRELGPLYLQAVDYVLNNYALIESDQRFHQLAVLATDLLKQAGYTAARHSVWRLFETDSETGVRVSCLSALGTLAKGDEEIIRYMNLWLEAQNNVFQTGKVPDVYVIYAGVSALGELGDRSSFPVLFGTMSLGYTSDITRLARESLFRLRGGLAEGLLGVLRDGPMPQKKLALEMALSSDRLGEQEKGRVAEFAMDVGLHSATSDNPSRQVAREIRFLAARALGELQWSSATPLAVEHLDTVLQEYDRGVTDKLRLLEAIGCLGSMSTHEAAVRLTQYLVLLNSYTERSQEFDGRIVLAVVDSLGKLGDKVAFDDLMYVQYLSYSAEVKRAARAALDRLRW